MKNKSRPVLTTTVMQHSGRGAGHGALPQRHGDRRRGRAGDRQGGRARLHPQDGFQGHARRLGLPAGGLPPGPTHTDPNNQLDTLRTPPSSRWSRKGNHEDSGRRQVGRGPTRDPASPHSTQMPSWGAGVHLLKNPDSPAEPTLTRPNNMGKVLLSSSHLFSVPHLFPPHPWTAGFFSCPRPKYALFCVIPILAAHPHRRSSRRPTVITGPHNRRPADQPIGNTTLCFSRPLTASPRTGPPGGERPKR